MRWKDIIEPNAVEVDVLDEGDIIKPLNPEQARKRAARQARMQQKMRDEQARHAAKLRDLRSRMNEP